MSQIMYLLIGTVNPQENTATWIEMFQKWTKKVPSQDVLNLKAQVDPNHVTKMPFHSIIAPPHPFVGLRISILLLSLHIKVESYFWSIPAEK